MFRPCLGYFNRFEQAALKPFPFTAARIELLSAQVENHMETLLRDQATQLLSSCGLADKIRRLNDFQRNTVQAQLSKVDGMDAVTLATALKIFYSNLFALGTMVSPQCERYQLVRFNNYVLLCMCCCVLFQSLCNHYNHLRAM
jgi:hypothetical protein